MVEQAPTGPEPDASGDGPPGGSARFGPRPAPPPPEDVGSDPDPDPGPDADVRIERLFKEAVERQLEEQRELTRRLDETVRRLEQVEGAVAGVRDRLEEVLSGADEGDRAPRGDVTQALRAAVEDGLAGVRSDLTEELDEIGERVDHLLGSGLTDVASRLGEEVATLRSRTALARDQRREEGRTANEVRALSERLEELLARLRDSGVLSPEQVAEVVRDAASAEGSRVRDALDDALDRVADRLDELPSEARLVAVYERLEATLTELDERGTDELLVRLSEDVGEVARAGAEDRTRLVALRADLLTLVEDLLGEGLADLRGTVDRAGGEIAGVRERVAQVVAGLEQQIGRTASDLDGRIGLAESRVGEHVTRAETRVGDRLGDAEARLADRLEALEGLADRLEGRVVQEVAGVGERVEETGTELARQIAGVGDDVGRRVDAVGEDVGRRVARSAAGLADRVDRTESRAGERIGQAESRLGDRLGILAADVAERLDAILETVGEAEGEEARRRLALTLTQALDGNVCRTCGFVAASASGLATHRRSHEAHA